ncbi:antibiotic biosynthesis monooxygenase [Pseudomonas japonica]|uniref:antibiotic biosynthesis monooxygenase n=1 Tax=Pseudomonas japonica TaxID=256466 RepID=UPI0038006725
MTESSMLRPDAHPVAATAGEGVTLVVRHRIKAGHEAAYEGWLRQTVSTAAQRPGHLGVDVVRGRDGGLHTFTSVLRYSSVEALQAWLDSAERRELVSQVEAMLADGDQVELHPFKEFWFTPPSDTASAPPPRWKQALVTLLVILPHTLLVPLAWQPLLKLHPWLSSYFVATLLITLTIVLSVVYVCMPAATRLFAPWLQSAAENGHDRQQ